MAKIVQVGIQPPMLMKDEAPCSVNTTYIRRERIIKRQEMLIMILYKVTQVIIIPENIFPIAVYTFPRSLAYKPRFWPLTLIHRASLMDYFWD
jgi:hypothetical protein